MCARIHYNDKSVAVVITDDTYEVAFYLMFGGKLDKIEQRTLPKKKAEKKGYPVKWILTVVNVPKWVIDTWNTGQAYGNITSFVDVRNKLKKRIKRELSAVRNKAYQETT